MIIDLVIPSIFPDNIIAGIATGYNTDNIKESYFETQSFNNDSIYLSRKKLETFFSKDFESFYYQKQIHSDIVLIDNNNSKIQESDSIISNKIGRLYNTSIADCQSILVYDAINNAISAIHSGWKGTKLNIVGKTINKMKVTYGSNPSNLLIYLSPSASVDNYEVGEEFKDIFPKTTARIEGKYYFDNRSEILKQLLDSGVLKNNIESYNECTITNNRFHSHRRDRSKSGRMSAFIGIRASL